MAASAVYLHLYTGETLPFRMALHASVYVDGDPYEWTYGRSSDPATTHGRTLHGVVYERPFQYTYGQWKFWKAVEVGTTRRRGWGKSEDGKEEAQPCTSEGMERAVRDVRAAVGAVSEREYHVLTNNCWDFCEAMLVHLGVESVGESGLVEAFNDEAHSLPRGTTQWVRRCCRLKGLAER